MMTKVLTFLVGIIVLTTGSSAGRTQDGPFGPVGTWQSYHKDGSSFEICLFPDGRAASSADGGQQGTWRWEGKSVRIIFTDGWDDVLEASEDGQMLKKSWGPGVDRSQPSKNVSRVERMSRDATRCGGA